MRANPMGPSSLGTQAGSISNRAVGFNFNLRIADHSAVQGSAKLSCKSNGPKSVRTVAYLLA